MKRIIVLLFMSTLLASCLNVDEVDPIADMVERAKADNEELIAYMKSHKLVIDQENASPNNINWEIQELAESDNPETESLFYLIGGSPYIHVWEGLEFKLYCYVIEDGGGISPKKEDNIVVDYNAFYMPDNLVDETTNNSIEFPLSRLFGAWQVAIPEFFRAGVKEENFPEDCNDCDPHREQISNPGKGIILAPSILNNGRDIMRFDIILYDVVVNEEEK